MVKVGVSFYYVGDIQRAADLYSRLLETNPFFTSDDWLRFHLDGGDLALHLDPDLPPATAFEPVKYDAVVSLTVEDIHAFLQRAQDLGFTTTGEVQAQSYGLQAQIRDPWGNRLSVLEPKEGYTL